MALHAGPAKTSNGVQLRLFVHGGEDDGPKDLTMDVPFGCAYESLTAAVADAVLGPEDTRWTLASEQRTEHLEPDGSGTIDKQQEWSALAANLHSHPGDDCCPVHSVAPEELPGSADVYSVMLGQFKEVPIRGPDDLAAWWRRLPSTPHDLRAAAAKRLLAKMTAQPPARSSSSGTFRHAQVSAKLLLEGLVGVWELSARRQHGAALPPDLLRSLVAALKWDYGDNRSAVAAEILETATAAVWSLAVLAEPRAVLVAAGVVPQLVSVWKRAAAWRDAWVAAAQPAWSGAVAAAAEAEAQAAAAASTAVAAAVKRAADATAPAAEQPAGAAGGGLDGAAAPAPGGAWPPGPSYAAPAGRAPGSTPTSGSVPLAVANRIAFNCLGALGVLAVDPRARSACLAVSPSLDFLTAVAQSEWPIPQRVQYGHDRETWLRRVSEVQVELQRRQRLARSVDERADAQKQQRLAAEARRKALEDARAARRAARAAAAAVAAAANAPAAEDDFDSMFARAGQAAVVDACGSDGDDDDDEGSTPGQGQMAEEDWVDLEAAELEALPPLSMPPGPPRATPVTPEDDPKVHQLMAAEALYTMLGRERSVRRGFAGADGLQQLLAMLDSPNEGVMCTAVSGLAAYARDVAADHTAGVDMLAESGIALQLISHLPEVVEGLMMLYAEGLRYIGGTGPAAHAEEVDQDMVDAEATAQRLACQLLLEEPARPHRNGSSSAAVAGVAAAPDEAQRHESFAGEAADSESPDDAAAAEEPAADAKADAPPNASAAASFVHAAPAMTLLEAVRRASMVGEGDFEALAAAAANHRAEAAAAVSPIAPHQLCYIIELAGLALWAAVAAEVRAADAAAAMAAAGGSGDAASAPRPYAITAASVLHISQLALAAAQLTPLELTDLAKAASAPAAGSRRASNARGGGGGASEAGEEPTASGRHAQQSHSCLAGGLHGLLGSLCVIQTSTRLVSGVFQSLLAMHGEMHRLQLQCEMAEDELQALQEEAEAARKQPGRFFFEDEEDEKRKAIQARVRGIKARIMDLHLATMADEEGLENSAEAAVAAVTGTLSLLSSHGATAPAAIAAQLSHCQLLAAGVIQAMAQTLQPGAVQAAAEQQAALQQYWENGTSISAQPPPPPVPGAPLPPSPEALAAAAAAAAHFHGPYRALLLNSSSTVELLLQGAAQRYENEVGPPTAAPLYQPSASGGNSHRHSALPQPPLLPTHDLVTHTLLQTASSALMQLTACEQPFPEHLAGAALAFISSACRHSSSGPYMSAALYNLARHVGSRRHLLQLSERAAAATAGATAEGAAIPTRKQSASAQPRKPVSWIDVATPLLRGALGRIRRHAAAAAQHRASEALFGLHETSNGLPSARGNAALASALRSSRFLVMATWLLVRQWLADNMNPAAAAGGGHADGLYAASSRSWWGVKLSGDMPLELPADIRQAMHLLVEALGTTAAAAASEGPRVSFAVAAEEPMPVAGGVSGPLVEGIGGLRQMAARCVSSLSACHPAVASCLVEHGAGMMMLAAVRDRSSTADSVLQRVAVEYLLQLAANADAAHHLTPLGGLQGLASALVSLVELALSRGDAWPSAAATTSLSWAAGQDAGSTHGFGLGIDVPLLEAAVRGLAYMAGTNTEGRAAVRAAKAVRRLVAVVRADSKALVEVQEQRRASGIPAHVRVEELICPLRAANGLPIVVPTAQLASLAALTPQRPSWHPAGSGGPSNSSSARSSPSPMPLAPARAASTRQRQSPPPQQQPQGGAAPKVPQLRLAGSTAAASSSQQQGMARSVSFAPHLHTQQHMSRQASPRTLPQAEEKEEVGDAEDVATVSRRSGDADVGLMALWGLLNLSGYEPAQVGICRHGLYTLLGAVHASADPARSAAARAILTNIHFHPGNATTLYKAELKLKYAALLNQQTPGSAKGRTHSASSACGPHSAADASSSPGAPSLATASTAGDMPPSPGARAKSARGRSATVALAMQQLSSLAVSKEAAAASPPESPQRTGRPGEATAGMMAALNAVATAQGFDAPVVHSRTKSIADLQGAFTASSKAMGASAGEPAGEEELDVASIEARLHFLKWVVDPRARSSTAAAALAAAGDEGGADAAAAAATGLNEGSLMAQLTADPEELCWLETLQRMRHQTEKEQRKHAMGTFMRGTFGRSLAEGAHSLWKPAGEDASVGSGAGSICSRNSNVPAIASNRRRLGSARSCGPGASAHSANARPASAAAGGQLPTSAGRLVRGAAGSNALRASVPSAGKAAASTAAPNIAMAPTSGRFATVSAAAESVGRSARSGGTRTRMDLQASSPSPSGAKPRSRSSTASAFAIIGNPWAPHILRFVQDRACSAADRTELVMQMLTAAPPEYIAADLTSLTERLVNLSSVRRQAEEDEQRRQAEAAAASAAAAEAVAQAAAAASWGLTLPQLGSEASQASIKLSARSSMSIRARTTPRSATGNTPRGSTLTPRSNLGTPRAAAHDAADRTPRGALQDPQAGDEEVPLPPRKALTVSLLPPPSAAAAGGDGQAGAGWGLPDPSVASAASAPRTTASLTASIAEWPAAVSAVGAAVTGRSAAGRPSASAATSYAESGTITLSGLPLASAVSLVHSAALAAGTGINAASITGGILPDPELSQALQAPGAAYHNPHVGLASPAGTLITTIRSARHRTAVVEAKPFVPKSLPRRLSAEEQQFNEGVPRPVTVLAASVSDLLAAKQARDSGAHIRSKGSGEASAVAAQAAAAEPEEDDEGASSTQILQPQPLSILVATGDGGTDRMYRFPRELLAHPRHMCLFEHVEGCRFCEALYGHYLLPSGRLAHFYLGDTVVKGHRVDLVPAPAIPFSAADWAHDGFPSCTALAEHGALLPARLSPQELLLPLWCPLPQLAPAPPQPHTLQWAADGQGLCLRSVCLTVRLVPTTRVAIVQEVVVPQPPPTPKGKKKKKGLEIPIATAT